MKHREFRAWHKKEKRWATKFELGWALSGIVEHEEEVDKVFAISEWTGLIDKNGRHIFEGDLIKDELGIFHPDKGNVVTYMGSSYCLVIQYDCTPLSLDEFKDLEIIDNIYENSIL